MYRTALIIKKGGAGKTTTCGCLGYEFAKKGRTCLVDCDHQGNLTSWLYEPSKIPEGGKAMTHDLGDYFYDRASVRDCIVNIRPNLDLLGVFTSGSDFKQFMDNVLPERPYAVQNLVEDITALGYDYILFDLSPAWNRLEKMVVSQCDEVIPVLRPEYFSVDGLESFQGDLSEHRKNYRGRYKAEKVVINGVNLAWGIHKTYTKAMMDSGYKVFTIGMSAQIAECTSYHEFIQEHDKKNVNIPEIQSLAETIIGVV
jgi:cellulose biosynthesis protein BcsQ